MADKEKNNSKEDNKSLEKKVHQDMVVRNMPKGKKAKISGKELESSSPQFHSEMNPDKKNKSKTVGFVIIIAGIILVIALIYLGYRYVVQPGSEQIEPPANNQAQQEQGQSEDQPEPEPTEPTEPEPVINTPTSTDIETEPGEVQESEEEEVPLDPQEEQEELILPPPPDSDSDGLNDQEEEILGTDSQLKDTDNDGYEDLAEIKNDYNPNGPGKLLENENFSKYSNDSLNYEIIYPTGWAINSLNNGYTTVFSTDNDSLVQISVQNNAQFQSILSWYEESFPNSNVSYNNLKDNETYNGIIGPEGFNFYLTDQDRENIYVISFIPALDSQLTYPSIFEMMIDSLVIK